MESEEKTDKIKIFEALDGNKELESSDLYDLFPTMNKNTVRFYRKAYFDELTEQIKLTKRGKVPKKHLYSLLETYKLLPLFIYSKLFHIVVEKYGTVYMIEDDVKRYNFSYFDLYMKLFDGVTLGIHDNDIISFMENVEVNYGQVFTDMFHMTEDDKECREISYLEIPDKVRKKSDYGEQYNEHWKEYLENIQKHIEETKEFVSEILNEYPELYQIDIVRIKILYFIFFEHQSIDQIIDYRHPKYTQKDIAKICIEYNTYCEEKLDFTEEIMYFNDQFVHYVEDTKNLQIWKEFYIDLGSHGKEYEEFYDYNKILFY